MTSQTSNDPSWLKTLSFWKINMMIRKMKLIRQMRMNFSKFWSLVLKNEKRLEEETDGVNELSKVVLLFIFNN